MSLLGEVVVQGISWSEIRSRWGNKKDVLANIDQFIKNLGANSPSDWVAIPGWEELDDAEILSHFKEIPSDGFVVISDVCYTENHEPMLVNDSTSLEQFASEYLKEFGELLFDGDVYIFGVSSSYVGIFHHEGLCYEGELT